MPDDFFQEIRTVKGRKFYIRGDRDYNVPKTPVIWHAFDVTGLKGITANNAMEVIGERGDISASFSDKWNAQDAEGFTHGYPSTKAAKRAALKFLMED
jgi:predicted phosphohydrolase